MSLSPAIKHEIKCVDLAMSAHGLPTYSELVATLLAAAQIIGHPDDAMSKYIADVLAKATGSKA